MITSKQQACPLAELCFLSWGFMSITGSMRWVQKWQYLNSAMASVTQDKQDCSFFIVICFVGEVSAKFELPLNKNFSSATIYT
jgi:hypothetical protein